MKNLIELERLGYAPVGKIVTLLQMGMTHWKMIRIMESPLTGDRQSVAIATVHEVLEDRLYTITYPIPKVYPGSSGRRTYNHKGDLTSVEKRIRKALCR